MKYAYRIAAWVYALGWATFCMSLIGESGSGKPVTWAAAWAFTLAIVVAIGLGWLACAEVVENDW